ISSAVSATRFECLYLFSGSLSFTSLTASLRFIQSLLLYIVMDSVVQLMAHYPAFSNAFPYSRRRNFHDRLLDPDERGFHRHFLGSPGHHSKRHKSEQFIVIIPFIKIQVLIYAHEEIKFIPWVFFRKVRSGVISIADTLLLQLKGIDLHEVIVVCSPVQHFQTVCVSCRGDFFKRGLPCRHENDPVQTKGNLRFHYCMDMSDMD